MSVPEVPAHISGLPRLITDCSYRCAATGGSGNFQAPLRVSESACIHWRGLRLIHRNHPDVNIQKTVLRNRPVSPPYFAKNTDHNASFPFPLLSDSNCGNTFRHTGNALCAVAFWLFLVSLPVCRRSPLYGFFFRLVAPISILWRVAL